jgi:hypothetical protein
MSGILAYNFLLPREVIGLFDMSQICDMGQTALLPFRRKACLGRLRPGANPRSWVPEVSMLTTRPPKSLDLVVGGSVILKWVFRKWIEAWAELSWLRIGTGGGLVLMRQWTFGFHKMRRTEERLAYQQRMSPVEVEFRTLPFLTGDRPFCF